MLQETFENLLALICSTFVTMSAASYLNRPAACVFDAGADQISCTRPHAPGRRTLQTHTNLL